MTEHEHAPLHDPELVRMLGHDLEPAGGAGTTPGLSYGVASGPYTHGWQTSAGWAGTCRRFSVELGDGSAIEHTADFMFFG